MTGNQCYICGDSRQNSYEVHHIIPRRYGGSDQPENLVTLCASCHSAIESLYDDRFYERFRETAADATGASADGLSLDSRRAKSMEIPKSSPHVVFEDFRVTLTPDDFDEGRYQPPDYLDVDHYQPETLLGEYNDYIQQLFDALGADRARELTRFDDGARYERFSPENARKHPLVIVACSEGVNVPVEHHRLHCAYCNTAFAPHEHTLMAKHLRMRHGVDETHKKVTRSEFTEGSDLAADTNGPDLKDGVIFEEVNDEF